MKLRQSPLEKSLVDEININRGLENLTIKGEGKYPFPFLCND